MAKIYVTRQFIQSRPQVQGVIDRRQVHFHFRPVRPADLMVSLDPVSREVNVMAGTYGPLSDDPFAVALHLHRSSHDSQRNVAQQPPGTQVVIALPGRNLIDQTWHAALPTPRGVNEADVARLTLVPSKLVEPPSVAECPVNLECVVDAVYNSGGSDAVFCRVLGASIDEEILGRDRLDLIREYPTHECDDVDNRWGGAVERLSVLGEILPCPKFPCGPRAGTAGSFDAWLEELAEADLINSTELATLRRWTAQWQTIAQSASAPGWEDLRRRLSRAIELVAWEEFGELRDYLASAEQREVR